MRSQETHRIGRVGWLCTAVLGANDGILSTASLVAGVAGLMAGAMSMAAEEYVSVHSQADTERAELKLERPELKTTRVNIRSWLRFMSSETSTPRWRSRWRSS